MSPAATVKLFFFSLSYLRYILDQMRIVKDKNVLWFCALFSVYHLFEMPYISFTNHTSCFHSTLVGDSFSLCWFEFWHFRASSFWRLFGAESFSSLHRLSLSPSPCVQSLSGVQLFVIPWTAAGQAPLPCGISQTRIPQWAAISYSRGFFRARIQPTSPVSPALAGRLLTTVAPGKP